MEEKKLTDEEIAKAILQSIEYSKTITYFDEWGNCKAIMITDILDFIHRLQSENAGLKERGEIVINSLHKTIDKQKAEIERLTLAVEGLKGENKVIHKENDELLGKIERLKNAYREGLEQGKFDSQVKIAELQKQVDGWVRVHDEQLSSMQVLTIENKNLQKQVDELTVRTSELFHELQEEKRAYARAVKDTAKEIYGEIDDSDILVVETQEYGEIEVVPIERVKEIIKSKGVEVE